MSERAEKAIEKLKSEDGLERVLDVYESREYVEVIGRIAGDAVTFRVYNDGKVVER